MIHNKQDGILSQKFYLNKMFLMFDINIKTFVDLFEMQIILENANQIQQGIIMSQDQLKDLSVTSQVIKKHYDAIFCKIDQFDVASYFNKQVDSRLINQLYENITSFNQNELKSFIEQAQILKYWYWYKFIQNCQDIIHSCQQILNLINTKNALSYQHMIELINPLHENTVQKIIQIHQQRYKYFKTIDNFEYVSNQIISFIDIYTSEFDFRGQKQFQLIILLQYFEILLDNKLQKHQYIDFKNFQNLENVRDPNKIAQVLQIYSDNLRQEFEVKFIKNSKITQNIRIQVKKVFKSQLVQDIMKDIQLSLNLPIVLSWDFLPYIGLVIIPNCNFKGLTLRNRGITINLTPFLDLYKQGFTDGYKDMMYAYCILVAINGWNCLQLIKKTQKSFYWYDDHIQDLNLEEFIFYKNLFGITKIQENKQLFSLQYLNQHTAKLILSIGEQQYTKDQLHHLFRLFSGPQHQQAQIALFQETLEEQGQINLKFE